MRTIITNFHNEEYLLPWWLKHHREIFDHGILLNDHSSDDSVEIIRELTPQWEIRDFTDKDMSFKDPMSLDMKIMEVEKQISGWKIHLNITEFFCAHDLPAIEKEVDKGFNEQGFPLRGAIGRGVVMIEPMSDIYPAHNLSLIKQNHFGFFEDGYGETPSDYHVSDGFLWSRPLTGSRHNWWQRHVRGKARQRHMIRLLRSRIYHKSPHGGYMPGRHASWFSSYWGGLYRMPRNDMMILWYGLSPWNQKMRERFLAVDKTREKQTANIQNHNKSQGLNDFYQAHLNRGAIDLMTHRDFAINVKAHL